MLRPKTNQTDTVPSLVGEKQRKCARSAYDVGSENRGRTGQNLGIGSGFRR